MLNTELLKEIVLDAGAITLKEENNQILLELFYVTEEDAFNTFTVPEVGFYINEYNLNYTCEDDKWLQYKITDIEALQLYNKHITT